MNWAIWLLARCGFLGRHRLGVLTAALSALWASSISAGIVTTGGITLVLEGGSGHPTAVNMALGKTAFAQDEIGAAPHAIAKVNDGVSGNANSWIAGTQNSFVGINLGATAVPVRCLAFGRDASGSFTDRHLGLYEVQFTTVANPDATTPGGSWTTVGTMDYQSAGGANFTNPQRRHVFNLPGTVMATGIRLKVNATTVFDLTCVDELELYEHPVFDAPQLVAQGERFRSSNLADGKVAFAQDVIGSAPHAISKLNNGLYGNAESWIAGTSSTFAGINLGGTPVTLSRVAFGRDNTGVAADRWPGVYTFQFTTAPNPDATTPDTAWITLGVVNYSTLPTTGLFSLPARRHLWSFAEVQATGFRVKIVAPAGAASLVALDELELYDNNSHELNAPTVTPPANVSVPGTSLVPVVVTYPPATATDDTDPAPAITYSHASGSLFPPGTTTVTVTATDGFGNAGTATFTVTVSSPQPSYQGGVAGTRNLAAGHPAFAKDSIGAPHIVAKVNDGIFGNANAWIAGSLSSFVGVNLGSTPVAITHVAFGRDNTGGAGDRWPGTYTLQYTTVPNPDETTPDASWTTSIILAYSLIPQTGTFTVPARRHMWAIPEVMATGFRLLVSTGGGGANYIGIDELELYNATTVETNPPLVTPPTDVTVTAPDLAGAVTTYAAASVKDDTDPAPVITYSHPSGGVFPLGSTTVTVSATDRHGNIGTANFTIIVLPPPAAEQGGFFKGNNLAAGRPAFAKDEIGGTFHAIANINDGVYGNASSWIAGSADSFIGINLGATPVTLSQVAWGRDNTGAATDRWPGIYTLQYTTTPNPDATTPDAAWTSISVFIYHLIPLTGNFSSPHRRHLWSFPAVQATGFRLRVRALGDGSTHMAVDELELYDSANSPAPATLGLFVGGRQLPAIGANVNLGTVNYPGTPTVRKLYVVNFTGEALPVSLALSGGNAANFTLNTSAVPGTLAAGATAAFTFTMNPAAAGPLATTLTLSTTTPGHAPVVVTVSADAQDTSPPVITLPPLVQVLPTIGFTATATFAATVIDNLDPAPVVTYSHASGSVFPSGLTSVLVTATDARGNSSSARFDVVVLPQLLEQGLSFLTGNRARGGTTFVSRTHVNPAARAEYMNDGNFATYWQGATRFEVFGISLGSIPIPVSKIAWTSHDDPNPVRVSDSYWRYSYALQFTTVPNPGTGTADADWITFNRIDYDALPQTGLFSVPTFRHLWRFPEIKATGIRFVPSPRNGGINGCRIQELEIYDETSHELIPPVIASRAPIVVPSPDGVSPVVVAYLPSTVTDFHDPAPVVTYSHPSGTSFPVGLTTVTVTATDNQGNTASSNFTVAVNRPVTLVAQGLGLLPGNLAPAATAFAKDVIAAAPHAIANLNNGTYGNPSSWIGGTADSFVGLSFGAVPVNISRLAFGRDNTGANGDRWSGRYVIETTTTPDPSASTPDAAWNFVALLDYANLPLTGAFSLPARRHLWAFSPISATGIRLRVLSPDAAGGLIAIDELELYNDTATDTVPPVIAPMADILTWLPEGGSSTVAVDYPAMVTDNFDPAPIVTYSTPSGSAFAPGVYFVTVTAVDHAGNAATPVTFAVRVLRTALLQQGGGFLSGNRALGGTAFAFDVLPVPPHAIANLNDGQYGNASSWIANSLVTFVGINLGSTPVRLERVAWGRDNNTVVGDRWAAVYTLQYTTTPNPDATTPDIAWNTIEVLDYSSLFSHRASLSLPARRHLWAFPAVQATGFRLRIQSAADGANLVAIDELELYGNAAPVAAPDTVARPDNSRVAKVLKSTLLANDTDADGDPLTITAVGNAQPVGATVQLAGNFVLYTAPANDSGPGSFTYTLSDGAGGHSVTGMVTVTQGAPPSAGASAPGAIRSLSQGADVLATFIGVPGRTYRVQYTTSLTAPYAWQDFSPPAAFTAPAGGVFSHTDVAPSGAARFYRAIPNP